MGNISTECHKDVVKRPTQMRIRMRIGIQHSALLTVCIELMSLCFAHIYTTKYIMEPGILICVCLTSPLTSQADHGTNIGFTIYQPFNLRQFSRVGSNTIYISSTSTHSICYLYCVQIELGKIPETTKRVEGMHSFCLQGLYSLLGERRNWSNK